MKKTSFIYSLAATFITAAVALGSLTACSSEDNISGQVQPAQAEAHAYTISIPASMGGDAGTRAVEFGNDGSSITTYFESTDLIYVTLERSGNLIAMGHDGNSNFTTLSVTPDGTNAKKAELSGTLNFYERTIDVFSHDYCWSPVEPAPPLL